MKIIFYRENVKYELVIGDIKYNKYKSYITNNY